MKCPCCGASVVVVSTSEGTHHYEPTADNEMARLRTALAPDNQITIELVAISLFNLAMAQIENYNATRDDGETDPVRSWDGPSDRCEEWERSYYRTSAKEAIGIARTAIEAAAQSGSSG